MTGGSPGRSKHAKIARITGGPVMNAINFRFPLQAWVDTEFGDPTSWLSGMAWAAFGNSMGRGALSLLIGVEPRIRTLIGQEYPG